MFKVGDIITGRPNSDYVYDITNSKMTKGLVTETFSKKLIEVKILEHKHVDRKISCETGYWVSPLYFELIDSVNDEYIDFEIASDDEIVRLFNA